MLKITVLPRMRCLLLAGALGALATGLSHATVPGGAWLQGSQLEDGTAILNSATPKAVSWNVRSSIDPAVFDHSFGDPTKLVIKQDGDYAVSATLPVSGTSGDRPTQAIEIWVDDGTANAPVPAAISQCSYVRNASGATESSDHLNLLLPGLKAGDVLTMQVYKTAGITVVTTMETASLFVEKVDASRNVFSAVSDGPTGDPNLLQASTTPAQLPWTSNRADSGYAHTDGSNEITLNAAGDYLVFVNIPLEGAVQRASVGLEILLNNEFWLPVGYAQQGYIRNGSGHTESSIHFAGLIHADAGQVMSVQTLQRGGQNGTVTVQSGKQASIYLEKLSGASGLFSSAASQVDDAGAPDDWNPDDKKAILWDPALSGGTEVIDGSTYTHAAGSKEIVVKKDGSYLLIYQDNMMATGSRPNPRITVEVNGVEAPGAQTKCHYIRNSNSHNHSSGTLVYLLEGLKANDTITVSTQREGNGATVGIITPVTDLFDFPPLEVARMSLVKQPDYTPDPLNPAAPRMVAFDGDVFGFSAEIVDLGLTLDEASVTATLDGADVTGDLTVNKSGGVTTVSYAYVAPDLPAPGSTHAVEIGFNDTADPPQTHTVPVGFQVGTQYATIPPEFAVSGVDTGQPGFIANVTQISTVQSGSTSVHGNSLVDVERQIAGEFIDPNTGQPYLNEAGPVGASTWEITPRDVPGIINFEQDDDGDGVPGPAGNFVDPDYPDAPIPGIPGWNNDYDGIAAEFLTFLELPAGFHTLGVNSDDGFRVTAGPSVHDLLGVTLGEFDGGRGAADTLFNVLVKEDGFYPVRMIYSEGNGGASVEFFSVVDGVKIPINASDPQAIKAYRSGPSRPYVSRLVSPDGTINTVVEIDVTDGSIAVVDGSVKMTIDGAEVSPTVSKTGGVTTISLDNGAPFSGGAHTALISYDETSTPVVTRTVTINFDVPGGQLVVLEDNPIAYWRLGETEGNLAYSEVGTGLTATYFNNPTLGEPRLVVGDSSPCVLFDKTKVNYADIPDHNDINIQSGNPGWKYKTVELWFKARNLPTTDPLGGGSAAGIADTQVIYEQGGITRGITIYLRGIGAGPSPTQAELWINTLNRAEEAWGGSLPNEPTDADGNTLSPNGDPVAVHTTIEAGQTYHLVFVLEGDDSAADSFNGTIKGYLNGVKFGEATGVHLLYNHSDDVAIGARNEEAPFHDFIYNGTWNADFFNEGNLLPFDGWIDEVALYNGALSEARIQAHYTAGNTEVPPDGGGGSGITGATLVDGMLKIEYTGTLKSATSVTGPYTAVDGATSPYSAPTTEAAQFFIAE